MSRGYLFSAGSPSCKHLALPDAEEASSELLIASAADVAALTASSQLTHLSLEPGLLRAAEYAQLFPTGRKLPHLVDLSVGMALLSSCEAMRRMAAACDALETVTFNSSILPGEAVEQSLPGSGSPAAEVHSWEPLQLLSNLKWLDLDLRGQHVSQKAWQCLGRVTQLEHLQLGTVVLECLDGLMQLTQLCRLEDFAADVDDGYISMDLRVSTSASGFQHTACSFCMVGVLSTQCQRQELILQQRHTCSCGAHVHRCSAKTTLLCLE